MGLFFTSAKPTKPSSKETKKKKNISGGNNNKRRASPPKKPSLTDPPNVYYTPLPPPPPPESRSKPTKRNPNAAPANVSTTPHHQPVAVLPPPFYNHYHSSNISQPHLQQVIPGPAPAIAGYLPAPPPPPPPPGWLPAPGPAANYPGQPPVIVNQHYYNYMGPPPPVAWDAPYPPLPRLPEQQQQQQLPQWSENGAQPDLASTGLFSEIYSRFENIMTMIDRENLSGGNGSALNMITEHITGEAASTARSPGIKSSKKPSKNNGRSRANATDGNTSGNLFSKVNIYANSKLPSSSHLSPLVLSMPAWPLLCLAAHYSLRVYDPPPPSSPSSDLSRRNTHIFTTGWRSAHKSLLIKSIPLPSSRTLLLSIRGTASFADWAVNISTQPASPAKFLDDDGNLCHSGFLSLAKNLVKPIAKRLRQFLQEEMDEHSYQQQHHEDSNDDNDEATKKDRGSGARGGYSLLLTGHSAGGAVAALLYAHMLSQASTCESELRLLAGCFKRIHCVTFGAPPVSLLPLQKPADRPELRKSLFLGFINEGDPVVRADRAYVRSLLELLACPAPSAPSNASSGASHGTSTSTNKETKASKESKSKASSSSSRQKKSSPTLANSKPALPPRGNNTSNQKPIWPVPPSTLSNAGRLIILRSSVTNPKDRNKNNNNTRDKFSDPVAAVTCTEDQLRDVIWGDPTCHMMSLYAKRIEALAVEAVTAASVVKGSALGTGKVMMGRRDDGGKRR